ncbi:hypothetical protein CHH91_04435 [Virgibacillus sp. 7505]|uniref:hypothetical protein n=1 Tax=Virgibacillus sp. 7505 TaxID=2022548 RepID=UPI000BA5AD59|nr:hypothetical protein [Virgibacillus sp. 7505]PAE17260.1 hypothetical protein CHH91_04435 [Virgibacillus sp. 7505]
MIAEKAAFIYRCEYCSKRFLTKQGAKRHEEDYCYKSPIPEQKKQDKQASCDHEFKTVYDYIPGEAVKEPQYDQCIHCEFIQ